MFKKILTFLWSLKRQFAKYFIIGIGSVAIDMGSLILLKELLGMNPLSAVILNQILVLTFVFLLNKYWSFKNLSAAKKQIARFGILASFNYFFSVVAMYFFNNIFGFDYRAVRIFSIIAMVSWNFFIYKYWVYAKI